MNSGETRHSGWSGQAPALFAVLALGLLPGCASTGPSVEQALRNQASAPAAPTASADYRVGCPDQLAVTVADRADWQARPVGIAVDGRIDLGERGRLRVEGQTPAEVAASVAEALGVDPRGVHVTVGDYRSQKVYIFGQVNGLERAVPFRGQETVLELLQRAGGITPGAELSEVYVIRAHVADGKRPECFAVNLHDIVLRNDPKTNLLLEPSDQVYIGETRRSRFEKCVPPLFRPVYETLSGLYRTGATALHHVRGDGPPSPQAALPLVAVK